MQRFESIVRIRRALVIPVGFFMILSSGSCRHEVSAAEMTPGVGASVASEPGAGDPAASHFDEAAFTLRIEPSGSYLIGKAGIVTVQLLAKGAHHVNQEYPHKLKLRSTEGVTYPQTVLGRESMKIANMQAYVTVPLTPNRSGKLTVGGDFAFSLCTADRCLIEKRSLAIDIQVP